MKNVFLDDVTEKRISEPFFFFSYIVFTYFTFFFF